MCFNASSSETGYLHILLRELFLERRLFVFFPCRCGYQRLLQEDWLWTRRALYGEKTGLTFSEEHPRLCICTLRPEQNGDAMALLQTLSELAKQGPFRSLDIKEWILFEYHIQIHPMNFVGSSITGKKKKELTIISFL